MPLTQLYLKRKISRLTKEIADIDESFYQVEKDGELGQHAAMLERKRDDIIRGAVLQVHTSIENVLTSMIICTVLNVSIRRRVRAMSTKRGKALRKLLASAEGFGFDQKLDLAVALGIINEKRRKRLAILNTIRNKCGHHWLLKEPVRRGRRPKQLKPPLLLYEGQDLHQVKTFNEFMAEFGPLYARLFVEYLDRHDDA